MKQIILTICLGISVTFNVIASIHPLKKLKKGEMEREYLKNEYKTISTAEQLQGKQISKVNSINRKNQIPMGLNTNHFEGQTMAGKEKQGCNLDSEHIRTEDSINEDEVEKVTEPISELSPDKEEGVDDVPLDGESKDNEEDVLDSKQKDDNTDTILIIEKGDILPEVTEKGKYFMEQKNNKSKRYNRDSYSYKDKDGREIEQGDYYDEQDEQEGYIDKDRNQRGGDQKGYYDKTSKKLSRLGINLPEGSGAKRQFQRIPLKNFINLPER